MAQSPRACHTECALTTLSPTEESVTERRRNRSALNIYVNPFPEWSRAMVQGNSAQPKRPGPRCPKCGSCDTRPSSTRTLSDFFLLFFDYSNIRCRQCMGRFRLWHRTRKTRSVSVL